MGIVTFSPQLGVQVQLNLYSQFGYLVLQTDSFSSFLQYFFTSSASSSLTVVTPSKVLNIFIKTSFSSGDQYDESASNGKAFPLCQLISSYLVRQNLSQFMFKILICLQNSTESLDPQAFPQEHFGFEEGIVSVHQRKKMTALSCPPVMTRVLLALAYVC